jgi:hypothetical protein
MLTRLVGIVSWRNIAITLIDRVVGEIALITSTIPRFAVAYYDEVYEEECV